MKSVAFFRRALRKKKSDSGTEPAETTDEMMKITSRSSSNTHASITQDQPQTPEKQLRRRSKSVGNLGAPKVPVPSARSTSPSVSRTSSQTPSHPATASSSIPQVRPLRPPRPPPLNLVSPPVGRSSTHPPSLPSSSATFYTTSRQPALSSSPLGPARSLSEDTGMKASGAGGIPRYTTAPKRAVPELDGVWAGFLNDVEEDAVDLHMAAITDFFQSPLLETGDEGRRSSKPLPPKLLSSPPKPSQEFFPRDGRSPDYSRPSIERKRPPLHTSRSTTSLPSTTKVFAPRIEPPRLREPLFSNGSDDNKQTISLSMFPPPPPLSQRKKHVPSPIMVRAHTYNPSPPPPLSPTCSYTPDVTPIATPVTPKFYQPSTRHTTRQSPTSPTRALHTPTSILKKSSTYSSPMSTPSPSFSMADSPVSSRPVTPLNNAREFPTVKSQDHILRTAYSSSQLRPRPLKYHRSASSDSSSDHSDCSHTSLHHTRYESDRLIYNNDFEPSIKPGHNYLQAQGRIPASPPSRTMPPVRFGYAI